MFCIKTVEHKHREIRHREIRVKDLILWSTYIHKYTHCKHTYLSLQIYINSLSQSKWSWLCYRSLGKRFFSWTCRYRLLTATTEFKQHVDMGTVTSKCFTSKCYRSVLNINLKDYLTWSISQRWPRCHSDSNGG